MPAVGAPAAGAPAIGLPPVGAPPVADPPVGAPPVGAPPVGAPPVGAPPVGAPPVGAPPVGAPPVGAPPVGAPPVGAPPVVAPPAPPWSIPPWPATPALPIVLDPPVGAPPSPPAVAPPTAEAPPVASMLVRSTHRPEAQVSGTSQVPSIRQGQVSPPAGQDDTPPVLTAIPPVPPTSIPPEGGIPPEASPPAGNPPVGSPPVASPPVPVLVPYRSLSSLPHAVLAAAMQVRAVGKNHFMLSLNTTDGSIRHRAAHNFPAALAGAQIESAEQGVVRPDPDWLGPRRGDSTGSAAGSGQGWSPTRRMVTGA